MKVQLSACSLIACGRKRSVRILLCLQYAFAERRLFSWKQSFEMERAQLEATAGSDSRLCVVCHSTAACVASFVLSALHKALDCSVQPANIG